MRKERAGRRGARRATAAVLLLSLLTGLLVMTPIGAANAAVFPPRFLRSIGGSGRPGVFAWGTCFSEFTDYIYVTDYLNFQVRAYDKQGNHIFDFYRPDPDGQPYTCAVSPIDGSIFVAELKDNPYSNRIAKYDLNGNFLYEIRGSGSSLPYTVWITIDDVDGSLWMLNSHYWNTIADPPKLSHYVENATHTGMSRVAAEDIVVMPPDVLTDDDVPRLYGVDMASDGSFYISDAWNRRVYHYARVSTEYPQGQLLQTFGVTQTGGDNRGVEVNEARDRVYVVDAEHSDVDMFTLAGAYVGSFGSEGTGPGQFTGGGRQLAIDDEGNVWVADFGGFEIEKYTWNGTPLLRAPVPAEKPAAGFFGQPRDVAVDRTSGEVWVADAWNQRFQRFSSTGALMGSWGQRGPGGPFDMNYPRHIAINPANRQIWISNERGHHIQVYNYPTSATGSPTYVAQIGQIGSDDIEPNHFRWPVDIEFYQPPTGNMRAIIGDRMAASVKIFDAVTRQEITNPVDPDPSDPENPMIPVANHGTAVDPATGNIYVVNPNNDRIEVFNQAGVAVPNPVTGVAPFRFGSSGTQPGQFRDPVDAVISQNILYVSDEGLSRVQAFDLQGTYLGGWGGNYTDGAYNFRGAIGLAADTAGRLYVTDAGNDRIQVYDVNQLKIQDATSPGTPTITAPANQQAVGTLGPVTITGTATDNASIGSVDLFIQDLDTGLWWDPGNSSWETAISRPILASYSGGSVGSPLTSTTWRYTFLGITSGHEYLVRARTRDANGGISQMVQRTFGTPGTAPVQAAPPLPAQDTTRPNGLLTFPVAFPQQTLPFAPITFTGTATDNVGVNQVRISLKRLSNNTYWSGSSSGSGFSSTFRYWDTTLDTPGGTSTGWTWSWTPRSSTVPGDFQILVQAVDAAGNVDNSTPNVRFTVSNVPPDTVAPDTVLSTPIEGDSFSTGPVPITGSATDNVSVGSVQVRITNSGGQYWTGSAWSATNTAVNATLATPGTTSTTWSYNFIANAADTYSVTATAVDGSGAADASPAGPVGFSTVGSADTTNPSVVQSPTTALQPTQGASAAGTMTISGTANDNVGVTQIRIYIRLNGTTTWWNGTSFGAYTYVVVVPDTPGATSSTFSYAFTPPAPGNFGYQVRAVDAAGNQSALTTWRNFNVT
jgi:hypothetical protein